MPASSVAPNSTPPSAAASPACACGRLRRATRALTQRYDDLMAPSGLRVTQFSLLHSISMGGSWTMSDLAEKLLLDRTALSRTLDPLAGRGLVLIAPGSDARTRKVSLTRAGEKALADAVPYWRRAQAEVARRIGADRLEALIATLRDIEALHPAPGGRGR